MNLKKVIIVTGGNKGIGSGIIESFCRDSTINNKNLILACRSEKNAKEKINELKNLFPAAENSLFFYELDLMCNNSILRFSSKIKDDFKHIDILYNNAAIMNKHKYPVLDREKRETDLNETFQTNFWGMVSLTENLIPSIKDGGQIVGLTTAFAKFKLSNRLNEILMSKNSTLTLFELHSLFDEYKSLFVDNKVSTSEWDDKLPLYGCYNISKMFLGAYTLLLKNKFSKENKNIKVNCVTPGWCKTDMGGSDAPRSNLKGAETCVWLESVPSERNDELSGNLYYDKKKLTWL